MPRPTLKDIYKAYPSGAYILDCDGTHDFPRHIYYFYTKKEVLRLWREEHPIRKEANA
jgi:hypothetical protein